MKNISLVNSFKKYLTLIFNLFIWNKDWSTQNLTITSALFQTYSNVFWKVELTVSTLINGVIRNGSNELILKQNDLPQNGSCFVSPLSGVSFETNFTVNCSNWYDSDGFISSFEFFCK